MIRDKEKQGTKGKETGMVKGENLRLLPKDWWRDEPIETIVKRHVDLPILIGNRTPIDGATVWFVRAVDNNGVSVTCEMTDNMAAYELYSLIERRVVRMTVD